MSEDGARFLAKVERMVPGGEGLARVSGVVTLVPGALSGDLVGFRTRKEGGRLLRAEDVEVIEPGPARRPEGDVCPRARDGSCGGCDWPAARLASHEALKKEVVLDALRRVARLGPGELPPLTWRGSPRNYRLRNRLHLDGLGRLGFFAPRSHDVSDLVTCEIVSESFLARLPAIRAALKSAGPLAGELSTLEGSDGTPLLGELRLERLVPDPADLARRLLGPLDGIRVLAPDGERLVALGETALDLTASGVTFRVSVSSFFQGNRHLLDAFLEEVRYAVGPLAPGRALDLYAGVGFLARPLIESGAETTAVEVDPSSFADLTENIGRWKEEGRPRARGIHATAEEFLVPARERFDLVVADPPRAGLSLAVRRELLRLAPPHVLLVSCDPPTLARDAAALGAAYRPVRGALLDLFPGTHHVETLLLFEKRQAARAS